MKPCLLLVLLVLLVPLVVATPADAMGRDKGSEWEISALLGFRFGGTFSNGNFAVADSVELQDIVFADAPSFSGIIGWNFTETGQLEGSWTRQETDASLRESQPGADPVLGSVSLDTFMLSALYRFGRHYDTIRPWMGVGLGATYFTLESGDSFARFAAGVTGGAHFMLDRRWAFRLQARMFSTLVAKNDAVFCWGTCWSGTAKSFLEQIDLAAGFTLRL